MRDLAKVINGTKKQFAVGWDGTHNAISLITGNSYTAVGGELSLSHSKESKSATLTTSTVYLNAKKIDITAYTIGQNNYFKLRDVGFFIDFGVTWSGSTNTIVIDTSTTYTAG